MRQLPESLCSKPFNKELLSVINSEIEQANPLNRAEIARRVCKALGWVDIVGKPKLMSARKGLLRLHRDGHIELPPPKNSNGNQRTLLPVDIEWPDKKRLGGSVGHLENIHLKRVVNKTNSQLFNALVNKYHYLGYRPLPGAQLRYLICSQERVIGTISFSGAAWKVAPRDQWIGWNPQIREQNLSMIINNTRFLILPWIEVKNLASKVLSLAVKHLKKDMLSQYGYSPVLLETFVDKEKFTGTCYRASNWIKVGKTVGRGRDDRLHNKKIPIKDIYVYPLTKNFRKRLGGSNG